jgi:5-formyltetrahydrofolate cyclo-ligase
VSADETGHAEGLLRQRAKLALRNRMRAVREALPGSACEARSSEITTRLLSLVELERASTVLVFASIRNEVRTQRCMHAAWAAGKHVALPRVIEDELRLYAVEAETELVEGAFGVPEPPVDAPQVEPGDVGFALVPALAVDPRGYRIGYGGGYYDKLIPQLRNACTCAVAYDFQLISEVPDLPHDVPVDLVVTDERVIRTN